MTIDILKKIIYFIVFDRIDLLDKFCKTQDEFIIKEIFYLYKSEIKTYIHSKEVVKWICNYEKTLCKFYYNTLKKKAIIYDKIYSLNTTYYQKYGKVITFISKVFSQLRTFYKKIINDFEFNDLELLREYIKEHYDIIKKKYDSLFNTNLIYNIREFQYSFRYKDLVHHEIEKEIMRLLLRLNIELFGDDIFISKNLQGLYISNNINFCNISYFMDIDFIKEQYKFIKYDRNIIDKLYLSLLNSCKSGNIEIVKYILTEYELYYKTFSDKIYYESFENNEITQILFYTCYSGNLKLVIFIIKTFNINLVNIVNQYNCLNFFNDIKKIEINNYCNCLFCAIVYNKYYHILNYILLKYPELLVKFEQSFSFHYKEWVAGNTISKWCKNTLYNPYTKIGKNYALKQIAYAFDK